MARYDARMTSPATTPRSVIMPYNGPGLFITAVGTDVGKTTVTSALAAALRELHVRVGVCKPVASGCSRRQGYAGTIRSDDDLVSADAEALARAAGFDPKDDTIMRFISPVRFAAPVSPALASQLEDRPADWHRVAAAFDFWQENCDLLLVEGAGGWYVPIERPPHDFMIADLAAALKLPVVVVTDAALGSINLSLLTVHAVREKSLSAVGIVLNRVPAAEKRDLALASNLGEIPRLAGVPLRGMLPEWDTRPDPVPGAFVEALLPFAREWCGMVRGSG
jgi:dethiobiotin synthetase